MNAELIFFVVVVSIFGGIALCGMAVFFYVFYRATKRLTEVAENVYQLVQPMSGGAAVSDILKDLRKMSQTGKLLADMVAPLTSALVNTNKLMMGAVPAGTPATEATAASSDEVDLTNQETFFVAPTEEEQAHTEAVNESRKAGVPVEHDNSNDSEPPLAGMVGSQV